MKKNVILSIIAAPLFVIRWFFLGIFETVKFLSESFYSAFKYFFIGFMFVSYLVYKSIYSTFKYCLYGIVYSSMKLYNSLDKTVLYFLNSFILLSFSLYKILKYFIFGLYFPFVIIRDKTKVARERRSKNREERTVANIKRKIARKLKKEQLLERKVIEKAQLDEKRRKQREEKRKLKEKNEFINKNVKIEKHTFNDYIQQGIRALNNLPKNFKENINKWYDNLTFVKNKRNRYEMEHQELLINFEGEDAVKSVEKIPYEYVVKNVDGQIIKGHYEAFSKVEVHSFLLSENYEVYSIKTSPWIKFKYGRSKSIRTKFKTKDLIFFLTQLSTYIKSGITLIESLRILSRQYKQNKYKQIIRNVIYELTMGENFSEAMSKQGMAFPRLLINMVKTAEMTGELPEALDDMADYYTEADKTRRQMITAMTYPAIILVLATGVIVFVLMYVVPQFTNIYSSMDNSKIPEFTLFVMSVSDFLKANALKVLMIILAVIVTLKYFYSHIKSFKTIVQWLLMHMPVFGNVIIYNEVTMFTKTFASLLKHNVFITESMEILTKVTNNEIYKMIILDTISNLAHGDKLSMSFKGHWAFPMPAYEMLVTGEKTGQLPEMMAKVSSYYQELHKNSVTRIKTFVEPILIIFLTVIVGGIVLAIIIPMFNLYQSVQG
ncbi:MAG: type II secretion system F family protein [Bacilli bacterium]|nr:type II secretion system F family protein [Bacilli bacterium]